MEFDQLLRRYLDGTLSQRELERFQYLLDRVPEYKSELRDTLEIRSLLHDDALNLAPPMSLSEHVQIAVGSSFAADAIEAVEERQTRRRALLAPLRVAAGSFVAVCILAGVALTPTLPVNLAGSLGTSSQQKGSPVSAQIPRAILRSSSPALAQMTGGRTSAPPSASGSDGSRSDASGTAIPLLMPDAPIATPDNVVADNLVADGLPISTMPTAPDIQPEIPDGARSLRSDVALSLQNNTLSGTLGESLFAARGTTSSTDSSLMASPGPENFALHTSHDKENTRGRRLAFGLLIGSGQVAEIKSLTALLQNSYYFSFGVNNYDRIGVEMGASSFERQERVAASATTAETFAKPTLGNPEEKGQSGGERKEDPKPTPAVVDRHFAQQITYGAVFYDRRVRVNSSWDLCGRVTVGGADNSVLGNVRAYAAYTPTANKNITLTMGVGGAGLFNLTSRDNNVSGNYGVYYGIETGF